MRRGIVVGSVIGWLLGAAMMAGWVTLSGGWYEYHVLGGTDEPSTLVNQNGWEPVPGSGAVRGYALNYRRPRFLPHADVAPPAADPTPAVTQSLTAVAIHSKAATLTSRIRDFAIFSTPPSGISMAEYTSAQNAYTELSAELDVDGDGSARAEAVRALLPPLKGALDKARTSVNNDALIRLAVQLDHAS